MAGEVERLTTQKEELLEYLKSHDGITQLEALRELGIMRLASRVSDLKRKDGEKIASEWVTVKARNGRKASIKRYYLLKETDNARQR